jgi:serine/threonine protein kinase
VSGVAVIEVATGPGAGQKLRLEVGESAVIGRGADSGLSIRDPSISRRHVELEHRADGVLVRDLGSKHGAMLDGRPIPRDGALVAVGATLLVGKSRIKIKRSEKAKGPELPGLKLEEKLGEGGAGEVFAAFQDPPGRRVAVKALAVGADELTRKRLEREAILEGRLDHPSILRVFGLVESKKRLYLVRELVDGRSLEQELEGGALHWKRAVEVGATIAEALAHAHSRGVVHRDVKPGNILIEASTGAAKLADFDLARDAATRATIADATHLTQTGEGLGTISYVAPEQLQDARHASAKADVYGLAAVLYHAVLGERPFARSSPDDYAAQLFGSGPPSLDELAPELPERLRSLIARALSSDPNARPDAKALEAELREIHGSA